MHRRFSRLAFLPQVALSSCNITDPGIRRGRTFGTWGGMPVNAVMSFSRYTDHTRMRRCLLVAAVALGSCSSVQAQVTTLPTVEVTTSKRPEPVDRVPAGISVVTGQELERRGARDLADALALIPGVQAPSGGDAGPSGAVPAFWGLHEFDAFLLVVDGVPWGGAFNPMITTLDLNDIQRIEVLKGAAPVMYGTTSFVGVVQVRHYPAGKASNTASVGYGSYGSWSGSVALALPGFGNYHQSLAIDSRRLGFADRRESVSDTKALYRGAYDTGEGVLTLDASMARLRDVPPSPIHRAPAGSLSPQIPVQANFNPADARIDQNQFQLAVGYKRDTPWGEWSSKLSLSHSGITDIRAFLHADLSGTADTQDQHRRIDDDYIDTHLTHEVSESTDLILGADALYGQAIQTSRNGNDAYTVPLDGSVVPPPVTAIAVNEIVGVRDRRLFLGQYAQLDWSPGERWDITVGMRLNETREDKFSSDRALPGPYAAESNRRDVVRPTAAIAVGRRLWRKGRDRTMVYVNVRTAYKPAAIDFGPDYQPAVLRPETSQSYAAGLKGTLLDGAFGWKLEGFLVNFKNLVVPSGTGALINAGGERLSGTEYEMRFQAAPDLELVGALAFHKARYTRYLYVDPDTGRAFNVSGHALPLSPHVLASTGLLYTPATGIRATLVGHYVGRRYLDERNTVPVGGYATFASTLGYRFRRYTLTLELRNMGNRRPPVTASEFGSKAYYLLNGRTAWLRLTIPLSVHRERAG